MIARDVWRDYPKTDTVLSMRVTDWRLAALLSIGAALVAFACRSGNAAESNDEPSSDAGETFVDAKAGDDGSVLVDAGAEASDAAAEAGPSKAATPKFTPPSGSLVPVGSLPTISITSDTPGAEIHYTINGSTPNAASALYEAPLATPCLVSTIRALALAPGFAPSDVAVGTFTPNLPLGNVAPVSYAPPAGTFPGAVDVSLSTVTAPAVVCFTVDGSPPQCAYDPGPDLCYARRVVGCEPGSNRYDAGSPVHVVPADGGAVTIKAVACEDGIIPASDVTASTYSFSSP